MEFPIYSMGYEPSCCPLCGARTEWDYYGIGKQKLAQHHICMNDNCQYRFLLVEEELD